MAATARMTGKRTLEDDGLIVHGVDLTNIPGPDSDSPEVRYDEKQQRRAQESLDVEHEPVDGACIEQHVSKYITDPDERTVVGLRFDLNPGPPMRLSERKIAAVMSAISGTPWSRGKVINELERLTSVLAAGREMDSALERCPEKRVRSALGQRRFNIWTQYTSGRSLAKIGEKLGCSHSTISRDLEKISGMLDENHMSEHRAASQSLHLARSRGGRGRQSAD